MHFDMHGNVGLEKSLIMEVCSNSLCVRRIMKGGSVGTDQILRQGLADVDGVLAGLDGIRQV